MATITTFSTLKTAAASWLDRNDMSEVGGPLDIMIGLMEAELYRNPVHPLRLRFMESALSVAISSGVAAIPADFIELKVMYLDGTPTRPLQARTAEWIHGRYPTRSSDADPAYYAPLGDDWIFGPYPASAKTVKGEYYALPTALSTSNETNWLTTNAPGLLLNGTLLQSIGFIGQDERVPTWKADYDRLLAGVMASNDRERFPREVPLSAVPG